MSGRYILDGKAAIPCSDLLVWGRWMETADRIVARTEVGVLRVSTVFLGLDHSFGEPPPLLFETMIFDDSDYYYQTRCSTWREAAEQHAFAVRIAEERVRRAEETLR